MAGMDQKKEYLFKVLVIGELATGKTALVKRYVHNFFSEHYRATVKFSKLSFSNLIISFYRLVSISH
jgi:GTPase SAR1 family protein